MCYFWENYNTANTGIEKAQYRYFGTEKTGGIPETGIAIPRYRYDVSRYFLEYRYRYRDTFEAGYRYRYRRYFFGGIGIDYRRYFYQVSLTYRYFGIGPRQYRDTDIETGIESRARQSDPGHYRVLLGYTVLHTHARM